jgi:hypothetical protein
VDQDHVINSIFQKTTMLLNGEAGRKFINVDVKSSNPSSARNGPNFVPATFVIFAKFLYHCKIENWVNFFLEEVDINIHYSFHNREFRE